MKFDQNVIPPATTSGYLSRYPEREESVTVSKKIYLFFISVPSKQYINELKKKKNRKMIHQIMISWLLLLVLTDLFGLTVEPIAAFRICPKLFLKKIQFYFKFKSIREKKVTNRRRFVECPKLWSFRCGCLPPCRKRKEHQDTQWLRKFLQFWNRVRK